MEAPQTAHCQGCLQDYDGARHVPMLLPCGHQLCAACVNDAQQGKTCPMMIVADAGLRCGTPYTPAQAIPVADAAWPSAATTAELCTKCAASEPATYRCATCAEVLCDFHCTDHRRSKGTNDHDVQPLKQAAAAATAMPTMCQTHLAPSTYGFCDQCDVPVCDQCPLTTHQGHIIVSFQQATESRRLKTAQLAQSVLVEVPVLKAAERQLDELLQALLEHRYKTVKEIETAFDAVTKPLDAHIKQLQLRVQQLKSRHESLRDEFNSAVTADIKKLQDQKDRLIVRREHVLGVQNLIDLSGRSDEDPSIALRRFMVVRARIASMLDDATDALAKKEPDVQQTLQFILCTPPPSDTSSDVSAFGALRHIKLSTLLLPSGLVGTVTRPPRSYNGIGIPKLVFGTRGTGSGQFNKPNGIGVLPDGHIVVADHDNMRLVKLSVDGRHVRSIELGTPPYSVAVTRMGEIWVALCDANCLRLYSFEKKSKPLMREIRCEKAWGVALLPSGDVVVGCREDKHVMRFDKYGQQCWVSTGNNFKFVRSLVYVDDDELVVCDEGTNSLQVLSASTGQYLRDVRTTGLQLPASIAFDPVSRVLLVGEMERISVWTLTGEHIHSWGSKGNQAGQLNFCYGICQARDGTIYFTDYWNNRVQVV